MSEFKLNQGDITSGGPIYQHLQYPWRSSHRGSQQEYLRESLKGRRYYEYGQQGKEAGIKRWLEKRREDFLLL